MFKKFSVIFLVVLMLTLTACGNSKKKTNSNNSEKADIPLTMSATIYDENNDISEYLEYEYNESDKISKLQVYTPDKEKSGYRLFVYDDNGNMIENIRYSVTGEKIDSLSYEYNSDNKAIRMNISDDAYMEYHYDSKGRKEAEKVYNAQGYSYSNVYTYDKNDNIIKKECIKDDGEITDYAIYKYDAVGFGTEWILYDAEGNMMSREVYSTKPLAWK